MKPITHHHHFKIDLIPPDDRVARCERYVIDLLLQSDIPDIQRENSIAWELKHHAGVTQAGRLLARKRGLKIDVCTVGALFHDIYAIIHGKYKNHAHLGAPIAVEIAREIGRFDEQELALIYQIVYDHSDKDIWSTDPYSELGKDADILDIFLYPGPFSEYLLIKSVPVFVDYLRRASNIWRELGLPKDPRFDLLENYSARWLQRCCSLSVKDSITLLTLTDLAASVQKEEGLCPPTFCLFGDQSSGEVGLFMNRTNVEQYLDHLTKRSQRDYRWVSSYAEMLAAVMSGGPIENSENLLPSLDQSVTSLDASRMIRTVLKDSSMLVLWLLADTYEFVDRSNTLRANELGII